ncbi:MAG: hypothetical protein NW217_05035 [Hyphomicrobiaceae bacterium]|nr:hypothetical protein [Hyphomicrobiaceae bacterium]
MKAPVPRSEVARTPARQATTMILVASAMLLPTLSLLPIGGLYLWEKGLMLWWALGALVVVITAAFLQRYVLHRALTSSGRSRGGANRPLSGPATADDPFDAIASDAEQAAWRDVQLIARTADIDAFGSAEGLLELGKRTVDAVARRLNPGKSDAVWRFTVPEALAITERVSRKIGVMVETRVPFGDQLTVAQVLTVYRWRNVVDVAERAYDIWRLVRLVNPAMAATQEARERLSRAMFNWSREHITRRIAEAYVEEIGRAAIDLYGGRLRTAAHRDGGKSDAPRGDDLETEVIGDAAPISAVIVGASSERAQVAGAVEEARHPAADDVSWHSTDAVSASHVGRRQLLRAARGADVLIWVMSAAGGPAQTDIEALSLVRGDFARRPNAVAPALIVAVTGARTDAPDDLATYASALQAPEETSQLEPGDPTPRFMPIAAVVPFGHAPASRAADASRLTRLIAAQRGHAARIRSRRSFERRGGKSGLWSRSLRIAGSVGGWTEWLLVRNRRAASDSDRSTAPRASTTRSRDRAHRTGRKEPLVEPRSE